MIIIMDYIFICAIILTFVANSNCHYNNASFFFTVSLVSSVPRLLVNNNGSDATGTVVYPQLGAPLEVWCLTEWDESNNRKWYDPNNTRLRQTTEPTDRDVYVLTAPGRRYVKILKFRSYQHSQAGRYSCNVRLINVDPHRVVSLSVFIGMNELVLRRLVMISNLKQMARIVFISFHLSRHPTQGRRCYCDGVW